MCSFLLMDRGLNPEIRTQAYLNLANRITMKMTVGKNMIRLEGDWTVAGMTLSNVDRVVKSLEQASFVGEKKLFIDCRNISRVDASGLHFLHIWLQWFKCRSIQTELVNLSNK